MNKIILIGNLTRDPELRTTSSGISVCDLNIAVNRRRSKSAEAGQPDADFFRVSVWREQGENCAKYLSKGRKVGVTGWVTARAYMGNDGQPRASLEVQADDVEFLSPRGEGEAPRTQPAPAAAAPAPQNNGFVQVDEDELPF